MLTNFYTRLSKPFHHGIKNMALKAELAKIRAGPNRCQEEVEFIGRCVGKLPNGRNEFQVDKPFFQDLIIRYEDCTTDCDLFKLPYNMEPLPNTICEEERVLAYAMYRCIHACLAIILQYVYTDVCVLLECSQSVGIHSDVSSNKYMSMRPVTSHANFHTLD